MFKVGDKVRHKKYIESVGTIFKFDGEYMRILWDNSGLYTPFSRHKDNFELLMDPNDILKEML